MVIESNLNYNQMLVKKLIPFKFLAAAIEIVIAGVILSTAKVHGSLNGSPQSSLIVGCIMVIVMAVFQIGLTFIGVNIYNSRIHFQNMILNILGVIFLIWFSLGQWQIEYIWYIWGFLCVYPFLNQIVGLVSVLCHSKKVVFEKYKAEQ